MLLRVYSQFETELSIAVEQCKQHYAAYMCHSYCAPMKKHFSHMLLMLLCAGTDPRVDPEALELAFEFENACNIFLRQASRSFLTILEGEGLILPPP